MSGTIRTVALGAVVVSTAMLVAVAADGQTTAQPVVVLDTMGVWRMHQTLKPPVIALDDGPRPVMTDVIWLNRETAAPPADWTQPGFDDSLWLRGSARASARTPYLARLCMRARFEVTDPANVKDLKLSLGYYGGVIVTLNGQEVARAHLGKGGGKADLADGYPKEAFVDDDGKLLPSGWTISRHPKALELRERTLADVAVPADRLRKGVNVLAIQIVRAPYHRTVDEKKGTARRERAVKDRGTPYDLSWSTCELRSVRLTAGAADGLVPNTARPEGLQLWNSDFLAEDYSSDVGDRCDPLRPIALQGARNGWFSGKVVLGSSGPIAGLKVTASDLKQGDSAIPASQVRLRYATPWGRSSAYSGAHPRSAAVLGSLVESPPAEFPAGAGGTVVPIWVTVRVPKDARPGAYQGKLTVEVAGHQPLTAPVSLDVADWALPDTADYRTWVELVQSPDTLVAEYGVPFWSDRHWEMIAKAMDFIGEAGSRVVYVPLICHTNYGNRESMVRWIKKDDGGYDHDFSAMDKYLDLAEKHMGRPKFVVFTAWEVYLDTPSGPVVINEKDSSYVRKEKSWAAARWDLRGKGPAVTALNPATGETATVYLPRYEDPAAKAMWKPLFAELRKRMAARGLEKAMVLGMASDRWPKKDELAVLQDISGNLPWVMHTHGGSRVRPTMYGTADVAYIACVWNCEYPTDPSEGRTYGWKRPELICQYKRFSAINHWPASTLVHFAELNITGQQRGVGRIGADFWPTVKDKRGQRKGYVWAEQLQSRWHSLDLHSHLLAPGPKGPVASTRYEVFRQGVQHCEARIAIERALTDDALKAKLGPDLAKRCQDVLDDRVRDMWRACSGMQLTGRPSGYATQAVSKYRTGGAAGHCWYVGAGWQERTRELFAQAGQVENKLAGK